MADGRPAGGVRLPQPRGRGGVDARRPTSYDDWLLPDGPGRHVERTLVLELDGGVVGDLYLHVEDAWAQHEVRDAAKDSQRRDRVVPGLRRHQGQGYVTEAATELVRVCFEDLGLRRVTAAGLRRQPALAAGDGEARDAPRGPAPAGVAAPRPRLGRRRRLRAPARRVAVRPDSPTDVLAVAARATRAPGTTGARPVVPQLSITAGHDCPPMKFRAGRVAAGGSGS